MDFSRLRRPEWIVGAGSVALLGSMLLLPWYQVTSVSGPPGPPHLVSTSVDGWNGLSHGRWMMLVTIVAAFALVLCQASRRAPAIPVTLSWLTAVLGGLTVLWLIYRVVVSPAGGRDIGGWVGLVGACAIAYGGYASMRLEGIAPKDAPQEIPTITLREQGGT